MASEMVARKRFSPMPQSSDEDSSGLDDSLRSDLNSFSSSNATSVTQELEERFQQAMDLNSTEFAEDPEIEEVTQEEMDNLFAKDMFELSSEERESALQDIHGVADVVAETPDFCDRKREQMEYELNLLVSRSRVDTAAYQKAVQENGNYVRSLYPMFLRSERWQAREAAARLVGFFQMKLDLFGSPALTERITVDRHLSKDDRKSLDSGFFQILPVRDTAGRAILMGIPPLRNYKHPDNLKRTFFYMIMAAMEDDETQKAGMVMIGYNMGPKRVLDRTAAFAVQSVRRYLPLRLGSTHFCYDDRKMTVMMTVATLMMGATRRVRFRAHYGHHNDVIYKLSTFGIQTSALPIAGDGEPKVKNHKSWVKLRIEQEKHQASGKLPQLIVVVPRRLDVLLGRGKPIQEHFGNIRYHSLLEHYQSAYERSKKFQKMKISEKIAHTVAENGGRFLKQEGAGWVEVSTVVVREKIGHAFRTRRAIAGGNDGSASSNQNSTNNPPTVQKRASTEPTMDTIPEVTMSTGNGTLQGLPIQFLSDHKGTEETDRQNGKRLRLWEEIFPE